MEPETAETPTLSSAPSPAWGTKVGAAAKLSPPPQE